MVFSCYLLFVCVWSYILQYILFCLLLFWLIYLCFIIQYLLFIWLDCICCVFVFSVVNTSHLFVSTLILLSGLYLRILYCFYWILLLLFVFLYCYEYFLFVCFCSDLPKYTIFTNIYYFEFEYGCILLNIIFVICCSVLLWIFIICLVIVLFVLTCLSIQYLYCLCSWLSKIAVICWYCFVAIPYLYFIVIAIILCSCLLYCIIFVVLLIFIFY